MLKYSVQFQLALHHTFILVSTELFMIFIWAYLQLPAANLQVVIFAFLAAVRISDISSLVLRLKRLLGMTSGCIILQYIISVTYNSYWLNIILPALAIAVILKKMTSGSVFTVLLIGVLTYSAPPGAYFAIERSADILLASLVAWCVSWAAAIKKIAPEAEKPEYPLPPRSAFITGMCIFCATILYKLLSIPQGLWIVLTTIFIHMVQIPGEDTAHLIRQRIFSVPAGIFLGGLYSAAAVMLDYRLVYLSPLILSVGFFILYYKHDFFLFTLFFMFAFTVCADWMNGTLREFHFLQFLTARTLATIIGTAVLLAVEKFSVNHLQQGSIS